MSFNCSRFQFGSISAAFIILAISSLANAQPTQPPISTVQPVAINPVQACFYQIGVSTPVSGTISSNTTWTAANSPYIVTGNITVNSGVTLKIDPCTVIKFDGNFSITVNGTLDAQGTANKEINFTSNQASPAAGDWGEILYNTNSTGTFKYAVVRFATTALHIKGDSSPVVTQNKFKQNASYPVVIEHNATLSPSPNLNNNIYTNNTPDGIHFTSTDNFGRITHSVTLTKDNAPYIVTKNLMIGDNNTGQTAILTIEPGTEMNFNSGIGMKFSGSLGGGGTYFGALNAQGTSSEPIKFTSNEPMPAAGDWVGLTFNNWTDGDLTVLDYNIIEFAGFGGSNALSVRNVPGSVSITNTTFENNANIAVVIADSNINLTDSTFIDNLSYPIEVDYAINGTSAVLRDNTYTNNTPDGIHFTSTDNFGRITHFVTLTKDNAPYIVTKDLRIGDNNTGQTVVLTMEPGTQMKFKSGTGLLFSASLGGGGTYFGALNAQGTSGEPIKFTSNATTPAAGDWDGLTFNGWTDGDLTVLDYSIIEFAGFGGSNALSVRNVPGSISITNTTFENNSNTAVVIADSSVNLTDSTFIDNLSYPIEVDYAINGTSAVLRDNTYTNNTPDGIHFTSTDNFGRITHSVTLTKDNAPYIVTKNLMIGDNNTGQTAILTIEPGTEMNFNSGIGMKFSGSLGGGGTYFGALNAQGTSSEPIKFTSNEPMPAAGDWVGLTFNNWTDGDLTVLDYNIIEFAGFGGGSGIDILNVFKPLTIKNSYIEDNLNTGINIYKSYSMINSNIVQNNVNSGIKITDAAPLVNDNTIKNNATGISLQNISAANILNNSITDNANGIYLNGSASVYPGPVIFENTIKDNTGYNLYADGGSSSIQVDAQHNWWGTTDPVAIGLTIFDINDNSARPEVLFSPFLYNEGGSAFVTNVTVDPLIFDAQNGDTTSINYTLSEDLPVTINIYDFGTGVLKRTLLNAVSRLTGPNSEIWDGKDGSGNVLQNGTYVFKIDTINGLGQVGGYDPIYYPHTVNMVNSSFTPANFDPYKGEVATLQYDLLNNAFVTLQVGRTPLYGNPNYIKEIITNEPRGATNNTEYWDGRNEQGQLVPADIYIGGIFNTSMPYNAIIINTIPTVDISEVKSDPFIIYPDYGDSTTIEYTIDEDAFITVEIEDPSGVFIRTLVNNEFKNGAPPGVSHTIEWDGKDGSGNVVAGEGNYRTKVTAVSAVNGTSSEWTGNITVYK